MNGLRNHHENGFLILSGIDSGRRNSFECHPELKVRLHQLMHNNTQAGMLIWRREREERREGERGEERGKTTGKKGERRMCRDNFGGLWGPCGLCESLSRSRNKEMIYR